MEKLEIGIVGGAGGTEFSDYTIPSDAKVSAVQICSAEYVNSIQLSYINGSDTSVSLEKIGGEGGDASVFELQEGEYITGVSGCAGDFIDRVTIQTNLRTSDDFGGNGGIETFTLSAPQGHAVIGFYGTAGWFIDSLGLITAPIPVIEEPVELPPVPVPVTEPVTLKPEPTIVTEVITPKPEPTIVTEVVTPKPEPTPVVETVVPKPAPTATKKTSEKKKKKKKKALTPVKALQKVDGIGPKIASLLVEAGINGLADLSVAPLPKIQEVLDAAGARYRIADPTTWPKQAAFGAKDDWDGMKEYQATLKGGRAKK